METPLAAPATTSRAARVLALIVAITNHAPRAYRIARIVLPIAGSFIAGTLTGADLAAAAAQLLGM